MPYARLPDCSLTTPVCHAVPVVDGFSQPSSVMPVVRSSVFESGTVTHEFVPLKDSALLNLPPVTQVVLETVPVLPLPDWSAVVVLVPSSKAQPPTRPADAVFCTVTDTVGAPAVLLAASRATAVSVCGPLPLAKVSHDTEYG